MTEAEMGPGMEVQTFDRLTLLGRRWFFRIIDIGNREILVASEAYNRPHPRNVTASRMSRALRCYLVESKR